MAYRATVHNSTGFTPSRLFLGRECRLPVDLIMGLPVSEMNGEVTMDEFVERQQQLAEETFQLVREHLSRNAQRRKSAYDAKVGERTYVVGEAVWYHYPRKYTKKSPTWQRCYIGPYRVTRVLPPVNCVIQRSPKAKPFVVHADKLKRCYSAPTSDWVTLEVVPEGGLAASAVPPTLVVHQSESRPARQREQPSRHRLIAEPDIDVEPDVGGADRRPSRIRRPPTYLRDYACRVVRRQY